MKYSLLSLLFARSIAILDPISMHANSNPTAILTASDGVALDGLGRSVAFVSNTIYASNSSFTRGKDSTVYVFEEPGGGWKDMSETARLTVTSGDHNSGYTTISAIAATSVVVVASSRDGLGCGNLYVFQRPRSGWTNMSPTAILRPTNCDTFGENIAVDGDTIVAGDPGCTGNGDFAPGSAFVFQKPKTGWHDMTQTAVLSATDAVGCDVFGGSVAISNDTVVVGATRGGFSPPVGPGQVYIYEKPQDGWHDMTQTAEMSATTGVRLNQLGATVAIGGDTVAAIGRNSNLGDGIFVYVKPPSGWVDGTPSATLLGSGPGMLALDQRGVTIVSGTPFSLKNGAGTVRSYVEPQSGWQDTAHADHTFAGLSDSDSLGSGVGVQASTIAGGAPGATVNGHTGQGAVYVYTK
jgi:hypothetical protein